LKGEGVGAPFQERTGTERKKHSATKRKEIVVFAFRRNEEKRETWANAVHKGKSGWSLPEEEP